MNLELLNSVHDAETTVQVLVTRWPSHDSGLPRCAVASFALIVLLPTAAGDQLHAIGDNVWTGVSYQKVNVIARHDVVKYRKTEALLGFENPTVRDRRCLLWVLSSQRLEQSAAVERFERLEQHSMAVSDVPAVAGQEMSIGVRHRVSLEVAFRAEK